MTSKAIETVNAVATAIEAGDYSTARAVATAVFASLSPQDAAEIRTVARPHLNRARDAYMAAVDLSRRERGHSQTVAVAQRIEATWAALWSGACRVASKAGL